MPNDKRTVRGVVTGSLFGLCTNVSYEDGCQRPGDKNLVKDSIVISEASVMNGICEHVVLRVIEPRIVEVEPQPVRAPKVVPVAQPVVPVNTVPLTVDQIVKAAEQRKSQPKTPRVEKERW